MKKMTFAEVIQDIHAMDEELWRYERKYGLRSEYFYELYRSGRLRDEDPDEVRDYGDWVACYEIKLHREKLYDEMVRRLLRKLQAAAKISLLDLNLGQMPALEPISA